MNMVTNKVIDILSSGDFNGNAIAVQLAKSHPEIFISMNMIVNGDTWMDEAKAHILKGELVAFMKVCRNNIPDLSLFEAKHFGDIILYRLNQKGVVSWDGANGDVNHLTGKTIFLIPFFTGEVK